MLIEFGGGMTQEMSLLRRDLLAGNHSTRRDLDVSARTQNISSMKIQTTNFAHAVSPLTLLKNPMILMGLVAMIVTVGLPKLLDNSKLFKYLSHTNHLDTDRC